MSTPFSEREKEVYIATTRTLFVLGQQNCDNDRQGWVNLGVLHEGNYPLLDMKMIAFDLEMGGWTSLVSGYLVSCFNIKELQRCCSTVTALTLTCDLTMNRGIQY